MAPMTNRGKVLKYFWGLSIETNNFAFEVKAILGLESTYPDGQGAKIGLNGPHGHLEKYFPGLG